MVLEMEKMLICLKLLTEKIDVILSKRRTVMLKMLLIGCRSGMGISVLSHNTTLSGGVGILFTRVLVQSLIKLMRL